VLARDADALVVTALEELGSSLAQVMSAEE